MSTNFSFFICQWAKQNTSGRKILFMTRAIHLQASLTNEENIDIRATNEVFTITNVFENEKLQKENFRNIRQCYELHIYVLLWLKFDMKYYTISY